MMNRKAGIFALWLAGMMFLLHSVVPHHHHDPVSADVGCGRVVEHVLHFHHSHEEQGHSDGNCHEHLFTQHVIVANAEKHQQTGEQWQPIVGLPGTSVLAPEPSSLSLGIELWGNATARVLSPHIISHGLRAPPSVVC